MTTTLESAPGAPLAASRVIRLHPDDDVVIALDQLVSGTRIHSEGVTVAGLIPHGHKMATTAIDAGAAVRRYGQIIGFASRAIRAGQHVHVHNLAIGDFARNYAFSATARATAPATAPHRTADVRRHRARRRPRRDA